MKKDNKERERIQRAWDLRRKYINLHKQPRKEPLTPEQKFTNELIQETQNTLQLIYSDTGFIVDYSQITCKAHNCGSAKDIICFDGIRRLYKMYTDFAEQTIYWCFV